MKASELKPGQFFEWNGEQYATIRHPACSCASIDKQFNFVAFPPETEVNPNVPQCWPGDEPKAQQPSSQIKQLVYYLQLQKGYWDDRNADRYWQTERILSFVQQLGSEPAKCHICNKPATCHGTYEGVTGYSCDDCCGHGCEDGHCTGLDAKPTEPRPFQPGDWVVCKPEATFAGAPSIHRGKTGKILEVRGDAPLGCLSVRADFGNGPTWFSVGELRHAHPDEIAAHLAKQCPQSYTDLASGNEYDWPHVPAIQELSTWLRSNGFPRLGYAVTRGVHWVKQLADGASLETLEDEADSFFFTASESSITELHDEFPQPNKAGDVHSGRADSSSHLSQPDTPDADLGPQKQPHSIRQVEAQVKAVKRELAELEQLQPDADGWIPWSGGECPVEKGTPVDVRYRNGKEFFGLPADVDTQEDLDAWGVFWDNQKSAYDIVAYRIATPKQTHWTEYVGVHGE